jgi:hypothetical protein
MICLEKLQNGSSEMAILLHEEAKKQYEFEISAKFKV